MKAQRLPTRMPATLAGVVDYADLRKEITYVDLERMCLEAVGQGFCTVVVPSILVSRAAAHLEGTGLLVASSIGYPFGTQALEAKLREIEGALGDGASELDVVPHFGAVRAGRWHSVEDELASIRRAAADRAVKVVLEAHYLSKGEINRLAEIAAVTGIDFVANATGFRLVSTDPETAGRATPDLIRSLAEAGGGGVRLKATGDIRGVENISALVAAGASRVTLDAGAGAVQALTA